MFFVSFFALINSLIIIPLTGGDNIIFFFYPHQNISFTNIIIIVKGTNEKKILSRY
jgi:hypothetical protein